MSERDSASERGSWSDVRQRRLSEPGATEASAAAKLAFELGRTAPGYDPPHVPAEPDPGIGAVLERVRRAIGGEGAGDGREATPGDSPCSEAAETS